MMEHMHVVACGCMWLHVVTFGRMRLHVVACDIRWMESTQHMCARRATRSPPPQPKGLLPIHMLVMNEVMGPGS